MWHSYFWLTYQIHSRTLITKAMMRVSHTAYPQINLYDRKMNEDFQRFLIKLRKQVKHEATKQFSKK